MKVYLLTIGDQFLCKKKGKIYLSDKDIMFAIFYQHLKNAQNMLKDTHYWEYRKIDKNKIKIVRFDISWGCSAGV